MSIKKSLLVTGAVVAVIGGAVYASGPTLKQAAMTKVVGSIPGEFFHPFEQSTPQFAQVAPGLWWFNSKYTRSMIADTGDGLVVFDCFNAAHAAAMREAIAKNLTGRVRSTRIRAVVYSHHHFDHVRGGAALAPETVIADRDVAGHLTEGWQVEQILRPTKVLEDADALRIGSLNVQPIELGRGHADRLWAFYFPDSKTLFAPDLAFVRTFPPFNLPDTNYVGLQRQMRTVLALPFEKWIPSHFQISTDGRPYATRSDFVAYQGMMRDLQVWTREGFTKYGVPVETQKAEDIYTYVRTRAAAKYGNWVGYDSMGLPLMLQYLSATYLGF